MADDDTKKLIEEVHRPVLPVKTYRQVRVPCKDHTWAIDLMIMPGGHRKKEEATGGGPTTRAAKAKATRPKRTAKKTAAAPAATVPPKPRRPPPDPNKGFRYVFLCEDVFTKYIWYVPLKEKTSEAIWDAFEDVMSQADTKPKHLWGDQEGAWYSNYWRTRLAPLGITLYSTYSDFGVSVIESAIKTLKHLSQPVYEARGSLKWIDVLPETIAYYNDERVHGVLKMTPAAARTADESDLYKVVFGVPKPMVKPPKYKVGDWVRVARAKNVFEKGYEARWSYQPYEIVRIDRGFPVLYYLREGNAENVLGAFYEEELKPTAVRDAVLIQKVIRRQGNQSLVQFRGFPKGYEQWMNNTDIQNLMAT